MPSATLSPEAEDDLTSIVDYIRRDRPDAAAKWLVEFRSLCQLLADQPEMGEAFRTRRRGNVRRHAAGNYIIYYRPTDEGIWVVRVAHGARDQKRLL